MQQKYEHVARVIGEVKEKKLINYANNSKTLLSVTLKTKQGDSVKCTTFPSRKDPQKPVSINNKLKVGDLVSIKGDLTERTYEAKNGREYTSYDAIVHVYWDEDPETSVTGTYFNVAGVIKKRRGNTLEVEVVDSYENRNGETVENKHFFHIKFDEDETQCDDLDDLVPNTFVSIEGPIYNRFEAMPGQSTDNGDRPSAMGNIGKARPKGKPRLELFASKIVNLGEVEESEESEELDGDYIPF